jgi:RimJ/RimL family protein N-acetyltransferase
MFTGELVQLTMFETRHHADLMAYLNDPAISGRRYIPGHVPSTLPLTEGEVSSVIEMFQKRESRAIFAIEHIATNQLLGHVTALWGWDTHSPDIAVVIAPEHQRRGYARETLTIMLDYLFGHLPAHVVETWVESWNVEGAAFAEAMGFRSGGAARRVGMRNGRFYDECSFDILRSEWRAQKAGA